MPRNPTFLARFLRDGSTALQCRHSGTRYIIAPCSHPQRDDCAAYREGELMTTGPRIECVNAVESSARWAMRLAY